MNIEIKPDQKTDLSKPVRRRRTSSPSFCKRSKTNRHGWVWKQPHKSVAKVWYDILERFCAFCNQHHPHVKWTLCRTCAGTVKADSNGIPLARWCGLCQAGREHHETAPRADV